MKLENSKNELSDKKSQNNDKVLYFGNMKCNLLCQKNKLLSVETQFLSHCLKLQHLLLVL